MPFNFGSLFHSDEGWKIHLSSSLSPSPVAPENDPTRLIEHFHAYFQLNYPACRAFFVGTLQQTLEEAFHSESIEDVRLALYSDDCCLCQSF